MVVHKVDRPFGAEGKVLLFEAMDPTEKSVAWLVERGVDVSVGKKMWDPDFRRFSEDEIIHAAEGCVAVMGASGAHFTRRVIASLPTLRIISKFGMGYDSIDVGAATEHGIVVTNTPDDFNLTAVAEHTIASILALKKQLLVWTPAFMRSGGWRGDVFARYLTGNTIGIVGFGRIGRSVATRLAGWGVKIVIYDPFARDLPEGVTSVSLDDLLRTSDVVTLHATPTAETHHMIGSAELALMKPSALLINTGRHSLVDYGALREVLRERRIAGAALDVFEIEPPDPQDMLFRLDNVLVTPHSAAWTFETVESMGWHGARNLWALMSGEGTADIVNPEVLTMINGRESVEE